MDKAYEDDETRAVVRGKKIKPVVPPKKNRLKPCKYDRKTYRKRNMVERAFGRLDAFGRIYTRYDKTDSMFMAYISFALTIITLN